MTSLTLTRLVAGVSLCVLSASFAYDRQVVAGVLMMPTGEKAAPAATSRPAATVLRVHYAFEHSPAGMNGGLDIVWGTPAGTRQAGLLTARFAFAGSAVRWI